MLLCLVCLFDLACFFLRSFSSHINTCILYTCILFTYPEIKIGFKSINYSSSESQAEAVRVCVAVLDGELGTNITLHLDSHSDTAQGTAVGVLYIYL